MSAVLASMDATFRERLWKKFIVFIPYLWLLLFFLTPFLIVFKISLADPLVAQPPFTPLLQKSVETGLSIYATFDNYLYLFQDSLYLVTYINSIKLAFISTCFCLLIGYPIAYGIARSPQPTRNILLLMVVIPFWVSFLLRVYAWMGILKTKGLLNGFLLWTGIIDQPLELLYTDTAVYIGMIYSYLPFMILPLYANLEKLDIQLLEAAADLGARPWKIFKDITFPLSMPGVVAGCLLVFIPAIGEYVIPALLGGADTLMIGRLLFDEFFMNRDWPVASAVAIVLLMLLVLPIVYFQKRQNQELLEQQ
ncbi:MAG TPA: ABC transporter permease subunit [Gammaproteobacteria bacterium]|nr:ABC transporter permease subunit [Gammaproteobacteria bacterium]